jgi:hypothetical protein
MHLFAILGFVLSLLNPNAHFDGSAVRSQTHGNPVLVIQAGSTLDPNGNPNG